MYRELKTLRDLMDDAHDTHIFSPDDEHPDDCEYCKAIRAADLALSKPNEMVPHWAVAYSCNSRNPRARKWYRIARVIRVDGKWFEVYWHPDESLRSDNRAVIRERALAAGLALLHGMFRHAEPPCTANEMVWSLDHPAPVKPAPEKVLS